MSPSERATRIAPPTTPEDLARTLSARGISDQRLLEAVRRIPRARFVPPSSAERAYEDVPLPIGHGQVTTQPSLLAMMVEALRLRGGERVLEVGTGSGYQSAILAALCREVVTIERFADLASAAAAVLAELGVDNVTFVVGDGTLGVPDRAPYQAIVTSAAAPRVPPPIARQLADGGRLVHPSGPGGDEVVIAFRNKGGLLVEEERLTLASFVPMVGAYGVSG